MSTRSVIARKNGAGFKGVYHHWDGYPSALGATLHELRNSVFGGDTARMLRFLIDQHPAGWSTINADWTQPIGPRPDTNRAPCAICGKQAWEHYRQYYHASNSDAPSEWECAGRPPLPEGVGPDVIQVLGHAAKVADVAQRPEPYSDREANVITDENASGCGCEWAYVFDGNTMHVQSSYTERGKMIGMFGCGDERAKWHTVGVVDLNEPAPNWETIDQAEPIAA